ncbi:Cof-type HAD-IIB family hydrolase [Salipaludibacillus sp. LMS25]|jgi:Cof subfamily protein (haloacid dehalogenase superfamily)|uniref:Cof-type HAD-IIB family hydrolase n=1 Tax=Salipaludibacillus sp. LMS25 TaxID=2924031 RepID=UPI0020D04DF8|nr:Cof-type HAD-IIB family hydrolase [Salipaludibacillus sp. LMS25]UTR15395.1 Cof-type HAD-IIB family hydrolase [Salipaludibacillus sp. LMS25]
MDSHLIAVDLDGTLLTDNKTISQRNRSVLFKAIEAGHKVVIATGRPYRASKTYYQQLALDSPMVNFNGAFIHHPTAPETFETIHTPLEKEVAKAIIETCETFRVKNMIVEVINDYYLRYLNKGFADAFTVSQSPSSYGNLQRFLTKDPTSLLIHPEDHHHTQLRHLLSDAHAEVIDQRSWGAPWNVIEIVKSGLNKAVGLQKIAEHYQIPQEHIIAFGDEDNDLEMLQYAGYGVAMENAIEELKGVANYQTDTNEEDGIAVFLEDFFNFQTK